MGRFYKKLADQQTREMTVSKLTSLGNALKLMAFKEGYPVII